MSDGRTTHRKISAALSDPLFPSPSRIFISVGHYGGRTRQHEDGDQEGASWQGLLERDLCQPVTAAAECALSALRNRGEIGADVIRIPSVSLVTKCQLVNGLCDPNDLAVDVHLDARPATKKSSPIIGCTVLRFGDDGDMRPGDLAKNLAVASGQPNRGVDNRTDLYFLKHTKCRALVVELGFIEHDRIRDMCLKTPETLGATLASAIAIAYGLHKRESL